QATPPSIRSFSEDEGCEQVQYTSEVLVLVPHLKKCLSTINELAVYPDDPDCRNSYFPEVRTIYYKLYQAGFLIPAGYCINACIGGHATGGE
ncbi:2299_t:CDS:1, partial [Dentiscutata erythropus]